MSEELKHVGLVRDPLIASLVKLSSYVHSVDGPVVVRETHISWVLLAGDFAYKIKKSIVTDFLDYGTLAKRHCACCEEIRLGIRYASGLYLDVVPITFEDGQIRMDGDSTPIEFAVRMRRFDEGTLLSDRLSKNQVFVEDMLQLAETIARFHSVALKLEPTRKDLALEIYSQAQQNFELLRREPLLCQDPAIQRLENWTASYFENNRQHFADRISGGFIRECHGDLHCGNVVLWKERWAPFDGIEFNSNYSWIDTISDIAFLVMDLQELGHHECAAAFLNAYLEQTGDYQSLSVLRWYLVYRALVRAKVEVMRARQISQVEILDFKQITRAKAYIKLAENLRESFPLKLWITHGVSGSGKSMGSQRVVQQFGAIRIRSDVERKRLFKTSNVTGIDSLRAGIYSPTGSEATYQRLFDLAEGVLQSGFSVIVDATFLKYSDRQRFHGLANLEGADFRILDFQLDEATLKKRITHRQMTSSDASDATLEVLSNQLQNQEPLTGMELDMIVSETIR